jgi:hypothetical protein
VPRRFNTAGPCIEGLHYMVPPEPRLPDAPRLVDQGAFFVVHAPRQTGKSTTLKAICRRLNAEGRHAAVHFSCEKAEPTGDDYGEAELLVLDALASRARETLPPELLPSEPAPAGVSGARLGHALQRWAATCPRPLVLVFDEIDALQGDSLRSVLRQLRDLYQTRPSPCPHSVILCGLRDVRDYKAASGGDPTRLGTSSPFNVKVESSRVGDFDELELRALYAQHTEDTGQPFVEEALARAWELTQGQPWLVNAVAREVIEKIGVSPPAPITREHVDQAKERLILARQTHLDSLVSKLHEQPVRRVLEPILAGTLLDVDPVYDDAVSYVRDLGLIAARDPVRVANPIYREVIARVLAGGVERNVASAIDPRIFVLGDGRLDWRRLLDEFSAFWKEHGEVLTRRDAYHEAAAQLVLMAFLQRVANGGGHLEREYGVGRGRVDMLVSWPYLGPDGKRAWQREAVETKVWRPGKRDPLAQGLEQLESYLDRLGLDRGTLVLFDRRPEAGDIEERTRFESARTPRKGLEVLVLRG